MIRIIIDGYNLIFQCGLQPKSLDSPLALHRTRQRLIEELSTRIEESRRHEVMIVFDAKNPKGATTPELNRQGFKIAFAREYEDADAMVIEMIRKHSQPRQLTIASNDHRIQTAATRRNATAIDSDVWFDRLVPIEQQDTEVTEAGKAGFKLTDAETQDLIEEFSKPKDETKAKSAKQKEAGDNESHSLYNPFPDGYGEDLLE